jgi:predicted small secreted protein
MYFYPFIGWKCGKSGVNRANMEKRRIYRLFHISTQGVLYEKFCKMVREPQPSAKAPLLLTALVAVIGFSMVACDNGSGGGGNDIVIGTNPFIGTWTGNDLTLVLTDSTWSVTTPDGPMQGTYTRNGNSGSFYMNGQ